MNVSISKANRLQTVEAYYFATKLREVKAMQDSGCEIINAGIGNPDLAPPDAVVPALVQALTEPSAHGYQSYLGLPELRDAMAAFYKKQYGVNLNPASEIIPLMGSKEGILHLSMAFLNKGDAALIPNPGYSTYSSATALCEARAITYNLTAKNNWEPDFHELEQLDLSRVKIMWTNYPHMPTGAAGSQVLFEKLVAFARKHHILIVNDNPYSCVGYENKISIHQVAGAIDVALELNSISKTYNMAGWRVGMLTGHAAIIKEVLKVKTNMDSGMFYGVQKGAIAALRTPNSWLDTQDLVYKKRRAQTLAVATALDLQPQEHNGGLFIWCKLPHGLTDDKKFVDALLQEQHIFIAPGSIFGSNGAGYVRFSLCVNDKDMQTMHDRILKRKEA